MKRLLFLFLVLVFAAFSLGGCLERDLSGTVDPDEAMPYYQAPDSP